MFAAGPVIRSSFKDINKKQSIELLKLWMNNYNEEGIYNEIMEV